MCLCVGVRVAGRLVLVVGGLSFRFVRVVRWCVVGLVSWRLVCCRVVGSVICLVGWWTGRLVRQGTVQGRGLLVFRLFAQAFLQVSPGWCSIHCLLDTQLAVGCMSQTIPKPAIGMKGALSVRDEAPGRRCCRHCSQGVSGGLAGW